MCSIDAIFVDAPRNSHSLCLLCNYWQKVWNKIIFPTFWLQAANVSYPIWSKRIHITILHGTGRCSFWIRSLCCITQLCPIYVFFLLCNLLQPSSFQTTVKSRNNIRWSTIQTKQQAIAIYGIIAMASIYSFILICKTLPFLGCQWTC